MIVGMKCLNESKSVHRCISDFHDESFVDKIIVIDGESTDDTVQELKQFSKVQIFKHKWYDDYHYQEVIQSNILLSYIPEGELMMIMDFDERMSPELKNCLSNIDEKQKKEHNLQPGDCINFSRKTFEVMRYEDSPYAMLENDWPIPFNQIGSYPDYQLRLICKSYLMHWVNSPHHVLQGYANQTSLQFDILHYEKDDARDRIKIEKKWARCQARRKELGLTADLFETKPHVEIAEYYTPEGWK